MLTAAAIGSIRTYFKDNLSYAMYKVGDAYYKAKLDKCEILNDGRISAEFTIDHSVSGNITVTEVQLYNRNGVAWATKTVHIQRAADTEGILYRFRFTIEEED